VFNRSNAVQADKSFLVLFFKKEPLPSYSAATFCGAALNFTPIDPVKALYWSAVINGVVAVPIMAAMMLLAGKPDVMGALPVRRKTRALGWGSVVLMTAAVAMMLRDLFS